MLTFHIEISSAEGACQSREPFGDLFDKEGDVGYNVPVRAPGEPRQVAERGQAPRLLGPGQVMLDGKVPSR